MLVCKNADNAIRWQAGERLNHLFEERCDQLHSSSNGAALAVITDDAALTFRDLDNRANQVARFLIGQGLTSGDRVGLMFDKTADAYVALLAVLKINAAYVPLDAGFPNERIGFIVKDADVKAIVSMSPFRSKLGEFPSGRFSSTPPSLKSMQKSRSASPTASRRRPPTSSPTSSTPRARPAPRRASRSSIPASAIS